MYRKFMLLLLIFFVCISLWGCKNRTGAEKQDGQETQQPTGYDTGLIQQEYFYYNGNLYIHNDKNKTVMEKLWEQYKDEYVYVGMIVSSDNTRLPEEELAAANIAVGTPVYMDGDEIFTYADDQFRYFVIYEQ